MGVSSRTAFQFAAIVAMGGFIFGLDAALISGTVRFVTAEFGLNDLQLGSVVSAPGFGVLFALIAAGPLCDRIGRKYTLIIIAALYVLSAVFSVIAPSYEALVAARFIGGLAFASLSLASMYIGEIAPADMRGKLVSMNQITIVVGLTAAYFFNYFLLELAGSGAQWVQTIGLQQNLWRWMLGVEILPALVWLLLLLRIPESPRWLIAKNRIDDAKHALQRLVPAEKVEENLAAIRNAVHGEVLAPSFAKQFSMLFDSRLKRAMIVGLAFAIVQPITGVNAILFYAPMVFEQTGVGTNAAFMQTIIVGLVSLVFTVVALSCIDKFGRRPLVIVGLLWSVLSLFMCFWAFNEATYLLEASHLAELAGTLNQAQLGALQNMIGVQYNSDLEYKAALALNLGAESARAHEGVLIQLAATMNGWLVIIGIIGFIAAFHLSIGPIMWVVFSEIVPIHVRGVAIPMFAFVTSLVSFFVQKLFPWQLNVMGAAEIFLFYCLSGAAGLVLLWWFLPETKGKTIEQIADGLAGEQPASSRVSTTAN